MTDDATPREVGSHAGLGPLPKAALTVVHNYHTMERQVSTHGVAYYGSNWYAERECYTADQMRAYAAQERAAERTQRELVFAELLKEQGEHARARYALRDLVQALDSGDSLAAAEAMNAAEELLGPNDRAEPDPKARGNT